MAEQRLHAAMAPIDVLTRQELELSLNTALDNAMRTRYRGIDSFRFPFISLAGTGGTLNLGAGATGSDGFIGPEQGDVWMVRRINVVSSAYTTDTARYLLFRGSTPSDTSAYNSRNIIDGQSFTPGGTTLTTPSVPATGVAQQNTTNQAYTVVISANGATITNVSVNGITVGTAAGTYVVPAYGSISIAYSVATPTWTWTATTSFTLGQQVGVSYNPGNKSLLLQPGEQIFAQVFNSVSGNTYALLGEGIRVPAEMKGKILG